MIAEATLAIQNELTMEQLDLTIHAHPTLPESLMEAALAAQGRAIHIPNKRPAAPVATPAAAPEPAVAATSKAAPVQNREKPMVASVKPPTTPPHPKTITPKML